MTPDLLFKLVAIVLFSLGLYGVAVLPHVLRKVLSLNLMSVGVFLFLLSTAARNGAAPPDPVPHAMVITGIVVSISATALALALAARIHRATGSTRLRWWAPQRHETGATDDSA